MLEATVNPRQGHRRLATEVEQRIAACSTFPTTVELSIQGDGDAWLERQPEDFKLVWGQRGSSDVTRGVGVARRVSIAEDESAASVIERCRAVLAGLPGQRMYGGFAFRREAPEQNSPWHSFGAASFWLPRAILQGDRLSVVVLDRDDVRPATQFVRRLVDAPAGPWADRLPNWTARVDRPDRALWDKCIDKALRMFDDEALEKIVLARQVDFDFDGPLSPVALVRHLALATPACYHFCLQTAPHVGFVGATPERLFWREGRQLSSEVVAGTRPRGGNDQLDRRLGDELLASSKDQLEHDIVRKSIRQRLHCLVQRLDVDAKASLLRLANNQHLFSRVTAQLSPGISDGELIDRLHPTPAVGGYPTENALDEIRQLEPFQRGWYAAPVGWIGADEAEFSVAIRSGLVDQDRLTLYSGAGIVPGSTAAAEWDEIEQKISDFIGFLAPAAGSADAVSR